MERLEIVWVVLLRLLLPFFLAFVGSFFAIRYFVRRNKKLKDFFDFTINFDHPDNFLNTLRFLVLASVLMTMIFFGISFTGIQTFKRSDGAVVIVIPPDEPRASNR